MKTTVARFAGGPCTLEEFADKHGLEMVVRERPATMNLPRFYASFEDVEISRGVTLTSTFGDGASPEEAVRNYARRIAGGRLVVGAGTPQREEFDAPNEFTEEKS